MGHARKAKVKHTIDLSSYRISSLPQEIKAKILSNLSTDMAVRASILSSDWRNVWTIMPDIFMCDSKFCYVCPISDSSEAFSISGRSKFVTLVDLALSLHKGLLDAFTIYGTQSYHDLFARWMYMLSTKGPGAIAIKLTYGPHYKIPSSLFSISHLYFLYLKNCSISLPKKFEGFKLLRALKLKVFSSTDSDISNLISSCPLLDVGRLKYFEGINCLSVQAQTLQILEIEGNFEDLHIDAPNIVNIYLTLANTEGHQSVPVQGDRRSYLKQTFGSLTRIKTLGVSGSFLTYLSKGCMLTKVPVVFDHLEIFYLERCLWKWTEVVAACSLFQNAPLLSELEIWSCPHPEAFTRKGIWDQGETEIQTAKLDHLMMITLNGFMGLDWSASIARLGGIICISAPSSSIPSMARKKVALQWITNDSTRRATFKKRRKGLMKKASELATLCGVDACVMVYGAGESQPEVWPEAPGETARIVRRFKDVPELDQCKKMMDMEGFLRQRVDKLREQLHKAQRENRERETALLLHDAITGRRPGLVGLSVEEVASLGWMVENRLHAVRDAIERLHGNRQGVVPEAAALQLPPQPPSQPLAPAYSTGPGHSEMMMQALYPQGWLMAGGDIGALSYSGFSGAGTGTSAGGDITPQFGNMGFGFAWPDAAGQSFPSM
ncbi:Agamous-like MADS-box protein AGL80 [Dichanthelium oligosanthes]|uniref:Agamous-like MADS-box protein AGL80 n=1 Tax=Dichanthelium oligosanthes TaxID=888268 RepID=A0A1E5WBF8_9POAL|nr:Agamous-like MADS-box protein AGL80 [Dichanthelium oligosanthes]